MYCFYFVLFHGQVFISFQASAAMQMRSMLFWNFRQCRMVDAFSLTGYELDARHHDVLGIY